MIIILSEFKDHLAGNIDTEISNGIPPLPSLELQQQFLTSNDDQTEGTKDRVLNEHALLVSPMLEQRGYSLPSQCALLGRIAAAGIGSPDLRIMLNTNIPFSAFICGVQGSGKSHTTACIIGMLPISMHESPELIQFRKLLNGNTGIGNPQNTHLDPCAAIR